MAATSLRVDLHGHAFPGRYCAFLDNLVGAASPVPDWSVAAQLEMMDSRGIHAAVLSLPPPGVFFGDLALAGRLAREVNDDIAALVAEHPARFGGLAALPLPDVEASLAEIGHAFDELGLDGVALLTNVGGTYVGDPAFDPVFDELDRRGAYVFLHPQVPPYAVPLGQFPVWLAEFPFETTRAAINLIYSGTLERCGRLRLQLAHLGGAAPFLAGRIASLAEREPRLACKAPRGARAYLSDLYYDTGLSNSAEGLAAIKEVTEIEHVVFGTDWPYAALPDGDPAPALDMFGAPTRRRIESAHAQALVPRLTAKLARTEHDN